MRVKRLDPHYSCIEEFGEAHLEVWQSLQLTLDLFIRDCDLVKVFMIDITSSMTVVDPVEGLSASLA